MMESMYFMFGQMPKKTTYVAPLCHYKPTTTPAQVTLDSSCVAQSTRLCVYLLLLLFFVALVQQCCSPKRIHENRTRPMTHRYRIISFECSRERFRFFHTQTHKLTECRCVLLRTSHNSPQLFRTQIECSCSTFDIIITAHL